MSTSFLNALKQKSEIVQSELSAKKPEIVQSEPPKELTLQVRIEKIIGKNRLDVYFSSIPDEKTRQSLKDHCFCWSPDRQCWYHKDTHLNRLYLHKTFNAPDLLTDINADPTLSIETIPEAPKEQSDTYESEEYTRYKQEVNALIAYFSCTPADLMLKAVACLHQQTFNIQ